MRPILWVMAGALIVAVPAPSFANTRRFLTKALKGDNSEMRLGGLAAARGHDPGVKRFGAMLVRDHRNAKADAVSVASPTIPVQFSPGLSKLPLPLPLKALEPGAGSGSFLYLGKGLASCGCKPIVDAMRLNRSRQK